MKNDFIEYKGYLGSVEFNLDSGFLHGKVMFINDLITFEGENVNSLKEAFFDSVDEYLDDCKFIGKEPEATKKGTFNVRVGPELHMKAYKEGFKRGLNLNEFVKKAIENELVASDSQVRHSIKLSKSHSKIGKFCYRPLAEDKSRPHAQGNFEATWSIEGITNAATH